MNQYHVFQCLENLGKSLVSKGFTISSAESCTGGLLATWLTERPGSSAYFYGGISAYANSVKTNVLGIAPALIDAHGAVSSEVAAQMAWQAKKLLKTNVGISLTGVAGPDGGSLEKPVGTVWCGLAINDNVETTCFKLVGDRHAIREKAAESALNLLIEKLGRL